MKERNKHSMKPWKVRKRIPGIGCRTFLFLCFLFVITSCVKSSFPEFMMYYEVNNRANFRIKVTYSGLHYNSSDVTISVPDSIIMIDPGETKILFVFIYSEYQRNSDPERADTLQAVNSINIYKNDTILSNKNFMLTKYWDYVAPVKLKAELNLLVTNNDFPGK